MRELTHTETDEVGGGFNNWQSGGIAVMGMSLYSPLTAAFGIPIGMAMFGIGSWGGGSSGSSQINWH